MVAALDAQLRLPGKLFESHFLMGVALMIFLMVDLIGRVLGSFKSLVVVATETSLRSICLEM